MTNRKSGIFRHSTVGGEKIQAFVPHPLPPANPRLRLDGELQQLLTRAQAVLGQLSVASKMVPSEDWFLYGFVRKEAVISSQIEGTQATLTDVLNFEATQTSDRPQDVEEVCNYVDALTYARNEISRPRGLPLSTRLLCNAHKRLMNGVRGADKQPGKVRTTQNWIGGSRPGNARFVPTPPNEVNECLAAFDQWIHSEDGLPPLIRVGLAHVQFETIHPFLDGNGRIGRLLVALLMEHWRIIDSPMLYISFALKRRRDEYYSRLTAVRAQGAWEEWLSFFLECVCDAAENGVKTAEQLFLQVSKDRAALLEHSQATLFTVRLLDKLPTKPVITVNVVQEVLTTTKPTATKAIETLVDLGILKETTGKKRDRVYAYGAYLDILTNQS